MSPYPSQSTAPFNPSATPSLNPVHSYFTSNYTSFTPAYYPSETPMPARKKRRIDDDLLPLFTSPAPDSTADNQSLIRALTAEIEQLQKNLYQLIKEREILGYKKRAPGLDVGQKLDAIFKAVKEVAKWTLGEFLYHVFKLKNEDGTKFFPLVHPRCHGISISPRTDYLQPLGHLGRVVPESRWTCFDRVRRVKTNVFY